MAESQKGKRDAYPTIFSRLPSGIHPRFLGGRLFGFGLRLTAALGPRDAWPRVTGFVARLAVDALRIGRARAGARRVGALVAK